MLTDYTVDQFIHSNMFLGYLKKLTNESAYPYLLGYSNKMTIINLSDSIMNYKKTYNFLAYFFQKYGGLWMMLPIDIYLLKYRKALRDWTKFYHKMFMKWFYSIFFWRIMWRPGILANLFFWRKNKKIRLKKMWYPTAVFQFNLFANPFLQREAGLIDIVGMNISDTCTGVRWHNNNYMIPGNEKTILQLLFYYKMFLNFMMRIFLLKKFTFNFINKG